MGGETATAPTTTSGSATASSTRPRGPSAWLGRHWPPRLSTLFGAGIGIWGLSIGLRPLHDNSHFTHLATGRLILDGGIPSADPYSFTAPGEPWTVQSWLVSATLAGAERVIGVAGPQLFFGLVTGLLAVLVWALTRPARTLIPRLGIAALVLAVGEGVWSERPLMVGLVGVALVLLVIDGRLDPRWLLGVMWIWVNSHGSWPLAIGVVVCFALGRRLDGEQPKAELRVLWWTLGGILLGLVGPLGIRGLLFPLAPFAESRTFDFIVEWQSPSFGDLWARIYLLQIGLFVIALVRRPSYRNALPGIVFLAASLVASRNIAPASLVIGYAMAFGLADVGRLDGSPRNKVTGAGLSIMVAAAALLAALSVAGTTYNYESYPTALVAWADDTGIEIAGRRIVTQDFVGNWFEGRYGDEATVFIDDRYDMYPTEVVDDYTTLVVAGPRWSEVLDDHEAEAVIWEADQPLARVLGLDPEWRIAAQIDGWIYACRRGDSSCPG